MINFIIPECLHAQFSIEVKVRKDHSTVIELRELVREKELIWLVFANSINIKFMDIRKCIAFARIEDSWDARRIPLNMHALDPRFKICWNSTESPKLFSEGRRTGDENEKLKTEQIYQSLVLL